MTTNEDSPTNAFKNDSGGVSGKTKVHARRASIINPGVAAESPCIKREVISPKSSAPPAYPISVIENTMTRLSESETRENQTLADQMTVSRDRQFFLPPALAVSLYNQHLRSKAGRSATWNSLISPAVSSLQNYGLTHSLGLPQASHALSGDQLFDNHKGMTAHSKRAIETTCVTDESSERTEVSKRKHRLETSLSAKGEPLDLSQPEDAAVRIAVGDRANMLLDENMDRDSEPRGRDSLRNSEVDQVQDIGELQRKVKKEVVDDKVESLPTNAQQHPVRLQHPEKTIEPVRHPIPAFLPTSQNALAYLNHCLNFPTVLNTRNYFLPQGYGYIPAGIPAPNQPLTGLEPSVGLSQWVNFSMAMAVDSLRYSCSNMDRNSKGERKRKATEFSHATDATQQRLNGAESQTAEITHPVTQPSDIESPNKRSKLNDSNEGLHRSVSDDPGKRRISDAQVARSKLRRRNSAPSAAAISDQENKKSPPVSLHSYAGCLPPQCLHLLQASGNLSLADGRVNNCDVTDESTKSVFNPHARQALSAQKIGEPALDKKPSDSLDYHFRSNPTVNHQAMVRKPRKSTVDNTSERINVTASMPIYPKASYLTSSNPAATYLPHYLYPKSPILPFVKNLSHFREGEQRKRYPSDDDDDEHIQTLQISDASSDEEDDNKVAIGRFGVDQIAEKQTSQLMESLGYGKGPWAELDNGALTAFGSSPSLREDNRCYKSQDLIVPTKMACTVTKSFPQAHNGLARTHTSAKAYKTERKNDKVHLLLTAEEFRPHSDVTGSGAQESCNLLKLPTAPSCGLKATNSKLCSTLSSRTKLSERKLIGDIFQKSFRNPNFRGHNTSSPRCVPRLVFTSETNLAEATGGKKKKGADFESEISKGTTSVGELRHTEIPQTSAPEYSHKLFSFARTSTTKEGDNYNADSVRSIASQGSSEKSLVSSASNERKKSVFSNSALPFTIVSRARGSSTSSRVGSLDAKIGELRQKANERQVQEAVVSESNNDTENKTKMQAESMQFVERPSPPINSGLESRYRSTGSPFYDSDMGRYGKRNVAVIKPNQSVLDKSTGSTCPPKKRHMKRYSPELYSKSKGDSSMHNREVKSASPIPHTPFVSTNVLINNDAHSLNVQWCAPDRNPGKKPQGSKATTILTLQALRGINSFTLERNLRKYPRHVSSPRSDAVIVFESRMAGGAMDERDQRLEIEDLEISDDEGQAQ